MADGVPDHPLVVHVGPGGDLPRQQDHPRFGHGLCRDKGDVSTVSPPPHSPTCCPLVPLLTARHLGIGVLFEVGIQDSIADLVTDFIWGHGEQEASRWRGTAQHGTALPSGASSPGIGAP